MPTWSYTRLYANVLNVDERKLTVEWAIWIHFTAAEPEKEYVRIHHEVTEGQGYFSNAADRAIAQLHRHMGSMGIRGWELASIHHQGIFLQSEFGVWYVPIFYFEKCMD